MHDFKHYGHHLMQFLHHPWNIFDLPKPYHHYLNMTLNLITITSVTLALLGFFIFIFHEYHEYRKIARGYHQPLGRKNEKELNRRYIASHASWTDLFSIRESIFKTTIEMLLSFIAIWILIISTLLVIMLAYKWGYRFILPNNLMKHWAIIGPITIMILSYLVSLKHSKPQWLKLWIIIINILSFVVLVFGLI